MLVARNGLVESASEDMYQNIIMKSMKHYKHDGICLRKIVNKHCQFEDSNVIVDHNIKLSVNEQHLILKVLLSVEPNFHLKSVVSFHDCTKRST